MAKKPKIPKKRNPIAPELQRAIFHGRAISRPERADPYSRKLRKHEIRIWLIRPESGY